MLLYLGPLSAVPQLMLGRSKEQPEPSSARGDSGADREPMMLLRDVSQQQPHGTPTFLHLSHSKRIEEQRISVHLKVKSSFSHGSLCRFVVHLCFPSRSSPGGQRSRRGGSARVLLPLVRVSKNCVVLSSLQCLKGFSLYLTSKENKSHGGPPGF